MAIADLKAVRQKITRARAKLDELNAAVGAYMDPAPYRFVVETEGYEEAIVCRIDREPNPNWAHELAEIAYQARSCLDLLVRQLVVDSGNDLDRGKTQFPIFLNREAYVRKGGRKSPRDRMLEGVATRHRKVIDKLQPFNQRPGKVQDDPLAILQTVSNRDKHNDIYTAVAAVKQPRFKISRPTLDDGDLTVNFTGKKFRPYAMADGDHLIGLEWTPPVNSPVGVDNDEVHLEILEMETELGFVSDRLLTLPDIDRSVLAVSEIVAKFAARIKGSKH